MNAEVWVALGAAVIALVALIVSIWPAREASRTRKLTVLPYLLSEIIKSPKSHEARGRLYNAYYDNPNQFRDPDTMFKTSKTLYDDCQRVFYNCSEIGIFIKDDLLEETLAKDMLHIQLAKIWIILKHFAEEETRKRGNKKFIVPFQSVALLGFEALEENGMKELGVYHSSSEKPKRVVTEKQLEDELKYLKESYKSAKGGILHTCAETIANVLPAKFRREPKSKLGCSLPCCK